MEFVWVCLDRLSAKMWGYTSFINNDTGIWTIWFYYGSVGRDMKYLTDKKKVYPNTVVAQEAVTKLAKDKERKGYVKILNSIYFDLTRDYLLALQDEMDDPTPSPSIMIDMNAALKEAIA